MAVSEALSALKEKGKNDHSILFRSAGLFVIKVCQDESICFHYFFKETTPSLEWVFFQFQLQQLVIVYFSEYLNSICQQLYDILRPSLININHLEVLTELCAILKQMLNDQIQNNGMPKSIQFCFIVI